MEAVVALAVIVGGLFLVALLGRSNSSNVQQQPTTDSKPRLTRTRPRQSTNPPSLSFDTKNSRHLPVERTLIGPAWVVDGDTIKLKNTQIRLFGIDAPELEHPYGKKAKWALHRLCKGHAIRAEITDVDSYGRTVARCYLSDGRDLSAEMVKQGLAIDWPKFSGGKYQHLEPSDARRKLFLADARQNGRMHVWKKFEEKKATPIK